MQTPMYADQVYRLIVVKADETAGHTTLIVGYPPQLQLELPALNVCPAVTARCG
jgi:hypothetical protein